MEMLLALQPEAGSSRFGYFPQALSFWPLSQLRCVHSGWLNSIRLSIKWPGWYNGQNDNACGKYYILFVLFIEISVKNKSCIPFRNTPSKMALLFLTPQIKYVAIRWNGDSLLMRPLNNIEIRISGFVLPLGNTKPNNYQLIYILFKGLISSDIWKTSVIFDDDISEKWAVMFPFANGSRWQKETV